MKFKVLTDFPIANDSPDHIFPWGTMRDNSQKPELVHEIEYYFKRKIIHLDIGCSGGGHIKDFLDNKNLAIGIEGSDYSLVNNRAFWPELKNINLFTCDASREYEIIDEETNNRILFDSISAWEVIEHIHPDRLITFFENIYKHLKNDGIFIGSISQAKEIIDGHTLHLSVFTREEWNKILSLYFNIEEYPFKNKLRDEYTSFFIKLTKKCQNS